MNLFENIIIPVEIGDSILTGKFKNKKTVVKTISTDEHGMPTINDRKVVNFRIPKKVEEMKIHEGGMSELDIIRQQSKSAKEFIANVFAEPRFKKLKQDAKTKKYLTDMWNGITESKLNEDVFVLWADGVSGNLTKAVKKAKYKGKAGKSWDKEYRANANAGHGTVFFITANNVQDAKTKLLGAKPTETSKNVYTVRESNEISELRQLIREEILKKRMGNLITFALRNGLLNGTEAFSSKVKRAAKDEAESLRDDWPEDAGFGSSDTTASVANMLQGAGFKTAYKSGLLIRKDIKNGRYK